MMNLSERQNPTSHILGNGCDTKRVTYAECPTLNSTDNEHLCKGLNPERSQVKVGQNDNVRRGKEVTRVAQKACQKRDEEIEPKCEEKPCEIKDAFDQK